MRTPRLLYHATLIAAVVGLIALTTAAPGQQDKKGKKNESGEDTVSIVRPPYDYDTTYCPHELKVNYTTEKSNLEVAIQYNGKAVSPQNAPPTGGTLTFTLDFAGDTTGESVTVVLRDKTTGAVMDSDTVYYLNFICGGMMVQAMREPFPADTLPQDAKAAKPAEKAKRPGDPIGAGLHYGHFPPYDAKDLGFQARVWVQGKFKQGPLKPEYDIPAWLFWDQRGGKWYPRWYFIVPKELAAEPVKPGGEVPLTVMRVVLLDGKGKVLRIMTHPH